MLYGRRPYVDRDLIRITNLPGQNEPQHLHPLYVQNDPVKRLRIQGTIRVLFLPCLRAPRQDGGVAKRALSCTARYWGRLCRAVLARIVGRRPGMDPSTAQDPRAVRIIKDAGLARAHAFFGHDQFDLGFGARERAQRRLGRWPG